MELLIPVADALGTTPDDHVAVTIAAHNADPARCGPVSLAGEIIDWEAGELDVFRQWLLFGKLIATGTAWQLQGMYGRTAQALIDDGILDTHGCVNPGHPLVREYAHEDDPNFGETVEACELVDGDVLADGRIIDDIERFGRSVTVQFISGPDAHHDSTDRVQLADRKTAARARVDHVLASYGDMLDEPLDTDSTELRFARDVKILLEAGE